MEIRGSTVLLTGATGGIGQAIAHELASRGAELILTGRKVETLELLARDLGARTEAADLSHREDVERLAAEAGAVDILVANAALPGSGRLETYTAEQIDRVLDVNLRAPMMLAHAMTRPMMDRGRGHLLFMSSLSGKAATARASIYNATKFGLRGFALALRADLRPHGVGVSVVCPGFIRDAGLFAKSGASTPPGIATRSPQDVARAVAGAIEHNRGEVDVAPLTLRLGSAFSGLAPGVAATATRVTGADRLADQVAEGQRPLR